MSVELTDPKDIMPRAGVIRSDQPIDFREDNFGLGNSPAVRQARLKQNVLDLLRAIPGEWLVAAAGGSHAVSISTLKELLEGTVVPEAGRTMSVPGYDKLAEVLHRAFDQASKGKGHERHSNGEPFDEQVMADMARRFGVGALLAQAFKKSEESQRLPHERAVAELLGAINYLAGAVIHMEKKHANDSRAA